MLRKFLLACGVLSSLLYLGIDSLAELRYGAYHNYTAQAISELGAIGAPTKELVEPFFIVYNLLLLAFAAGIWASAGGKGALRVIGALLAGIVAVGLVTPPMYLRGTGDVSRDLPHIVFTGVIVLFILLAIALGASLYGRRWRLYSWATIAILLVSGVWTGLEASRMAAEQAAPWLGVTERINIGAYLLWVAVLAVTLLRSEAAGRAPSAITPPSAHEARERKPITA